jgi:hypothetical protein
MTTIHRPLHDGADYDLTDPTPGYVGLTIQDAHGDRVVVALDRTRVRQLIDDLTLVAQLTPTSPTIGRAAAIAGAVRRNFELIDELRKTEPAEAERILAMIAAHLRSCRPVVLRAEVSP